MRALVVTVSGRASSGVYADTGGPILADGLRDMGFDVSGPVVVRDGPPVATALRDGIDASYDVILTTGGTGLSPTDRTPEMTQPLLEFEVPGIAEALRSFGAAQGVPTAVFSRGVAGVAGRTVVVNLPGSSGGCRDGIAVLRPLLAHAVDQVRGGDHVRPGD
jgi:molybdenum cofactor synthesis domain-containing protein